MAKTIKSVNLMDAENVIKKFMALDPESKNYALGYMEAMLQAAEHSKATKSA